MNLLFCGCPQKIYPFFTSETYPYNGYAPIPPILPDVPAYDTCNNENECATVSRNTPTPPHLSNDSRIGTTATPTVAISMTVILAHHAKA